MKKSDIGLLLVGAVVLFMVITTLIPEARNIYYDSKRAVIIAITFIVIVLTVIGNCLIRFPLKGSKKKSFLSIVSFEFGYLVVLIGLISIIYSFLTAFSTIDKPNYQPVSEIYPVGDGNPYEGLRGFVHISSLWISVITLTAGQYLIGLRYKKENKDLPVTPSHPLSPS